MKKIAIMITAAMSMKNQTASHAKALGNTAARAVRRVVRTIKGLWNTHKEQMETSDLYRALIIAITAALARQVNVHRLVLAIISALMNAYTAARDLQNPDRRLRGPFEDPDDGWSYA